MGWKIRMLLLGVVALCTGMECQGNTPSAMPLPQQILIPDGAYAGPILSVTIDATTGLKVTGSGHRVVVVINSSIRTVRIAPDKNGPFGCWQIVPGSDRTVALSMSGFDGNNVQTVIGATGLSFDYSAVFSAIGAQGPLTLTGQGTSTGTYANNVLTWQETSEIVGTVGTFTIASNGVLTPIGDIDALPIPDGMNGLWKIAYASGAIELLEIRGLRVRTYYDSPTGQSVAHSDPVVGTTMAGKNVYFSFEAITVFQSDPIPRSYAITFAGIVDANGTIAGMITFVATGIPDKSYDVQIERIPSDSC